MKTETVNYQATDIELEGYLAYPDEEKSPFSFNCSHLGR